MRCWTGSYCSSAFGTTPEEEMIQIGKFSFKNDVTQIWTFSNPPLSCHALIVITTVGIQYLDMSGGGGGGKGDGMVTDFSFWPPFIASLLCQEGKQAVKSNAGAIKFCKEIKITALPNERRNIPLFITLWQTKKCCYSSFLIIDYNCINLVWTRFRCGSASSSAPLIHFLRRIEKIGKTSEDEEEEEGKHQTVKL